jgi:hypothetical protein
MIVNRVVVRKAAPPVTIEKEDYDYDDYERKKRGTMINSVPGAVPRGRRPTPNCCMPARSYAPDRGTRNRGSICSTQSDLSRGNLGALATTREIVRASRLTSSRATSRLPAKIEPPCVLVCAPSPNTNFCTSYFRS